MINCQDRNVHRKIEKLSSDVFKNDDILLCLGGLKILITCLYVESTEHKGLSESTIEFDHEDPEVLLKSIEKTEIILTRLRSATPIEAACFGPVLSKVFKDLLPPSEVLTKVVKELINVNHTNVVEISRIIHQVIIVLNFKIETFK